jgi:hypothetical protein
MKSEKCVSSDDETEEGNYTIYECPGLAPTDEIEVKNPFFGAVDFASPALPTNDSVISKSDKNVQQAPYTPHIHTDSVNIVISPEAAVPQSK